MDDFEKLIRNRVEELNTNLPPEGHLERFEMKLSSTKRQRSGYWIGFVSGIAAVLVVGIFFFSYYKKQEKSTMTLSRVSSQYAEVEFFYTNQINNKINELNSTSALLGNDNPTIEQIRKELNDYDREFKQISAELNAAPNDERVISAMVNYYQTKLEIITRILTKLENEQAKSKNHENKDI